jgi:hypothetical protein
MSRTDFFDRAIALAFPISEPAAVMLRRAVELELAGEHERALALLDEAAAVLGRESSDRRPRYRVTLTFPLESDTPS